MASSSSSASRPRAVDDHDDFDDNVDHNNDNVDDDGFVLVSAADYPDGWIVVPMVSLALGRDMAKRSVFVVTKFQNNAHGTASGRLFVSMN
jgi:hypothetical protein